MAQNGSGVSIFFNNDDIHRHDSQLLAYALVLQIAACRPKGVQQWWFVQK
jgi:hypothetical protein